LLFECLDISQLAAEQLFSAESSLFACLETLSFWPITVNRFQIGNNFFKKIEENEELPKKFPYNEPHNSSGNGWQELSSVNQKVLSERLMP